MSTKLLESSTQALIQGPPRQDPVYPNTYLCHPSRGGLRRFQRSPRPRYQLESLRLVPARPLALGSLDGLDPLGKNVHSLTDLPRVDTVHRMGNGGHLALVPDLRQPRVVFRPGSKFTLTKLLVSVSTPLDRR